MTWENPWASLRSVPPGLSRETHRKAFAGVKRVLFVEEVEPFLEGNVKELRRSLV